MTASAGKKSDVYVTAGASVSMPLEAMSDISANFGGGAGNLVRTIYSVTNNVKRYFDPASPLTFDISLNSGGAWTPVVPDIVGASYIQFFASQQAAPAAMFRVNTGKYLPYSRMGGGHEWDLNPVIDIFEVSEFMQNSKHHIVGQDGGTIALKRWWLDDSMRSVLGGRMVVSLYVDATSQPTGPRFECLAILSADGLKSAVKGAVEEDLQFEIQSDVCFLSV